MFGKLWHKEQQRVQHVLELTVTALKMYNQKDLNAEAALERAIDAAIESFSGAQALNTASQLESLKAELVTAQQGVNPYTLEKPTLGRRQMRTAVAFRVMQNLQALLVAEANSIQTRLQEAEAIVQQILLSAMQGGLLTAQQLKDANSQEAVEVIWKDVEKEGALLVAKKKVILAVGVFDASILCNNVVSSLRSS